MKYGITSSFEETTFDKGEIKEESNCMASSGEGAAAMSSNGGPDGGGVAAAEVSDAAVVFSIQFYGKTMGEVGMMDQDLSQLDWKKFKSYLFQNLLTLNHQENICVSYSDEEGDKLPIDSDEEYQEALKVAKKKAEMHDKMVLDITRQGGFPAVLSLVSSGIKKVSSSPPKEGGISFFKASSPPKESSGFRAVGTERKLFQGLFVPDKGPIPGHVQGVWGYDCDEARECGKGSTTSTTSTTTTTTTSTSPLTTARTDCKRGPPIQALRNCSPKFLFNYEPPIHHSISSPRDISVCQDVFGAGIERSTGTRPKDLHIQGDFLHQPPEWFTSYMNKFRSEICEDISERVIGKVMEILKDNGTTNAPDQETAQDRRYPRNVEEEQMNFEERPVRKGVALKKSHDGMKPEDLPAKELKKKKENEVKDVNLDSDLLCENSKGKKNDKNIGVKRKKFTKEEERLMKKQEKIERKKFILASKYADEMDKASRTQEKVFAKMEGLRKKQFCSQEELSKLRKMVDKQQRFITAEQRQQRRNERKAGYQKLGKSKKINIDYKGFPVDASLLPAALQELEALAEDSTSDCAGGMTTRGYDAMYLKDITYSDGSVVSPGKEFVKTWRVVNNGVLPWNEKTTLCKWSQVRFRGSPAGWKLKPAMKRVVCPPLEPGQEGDISITFTAPNEPGWYATHWRFCQRGRVFGNQMWCAIRVEEEELSASGPSKPLLGKTVVDENGIVVNSFTDDDMENLKAAMSPHPFQENGHENYPFTSLAIAAGVIPAPPCDLGIVENYYDAEDPVQRDCTEALQKLSISCPNVLQEEKATERKEKDLISFEEEAELLDSGSSTPELLPIVTQAHGVVPLKEMAKESVESLVKDHEMKSQLKLAESSTVVQPDTMSMSSGSFSELDSEDQAILNESDSEGSDHEYYVVHLPDCFNTNSLHEGLSKISKSSAQENPTGWREDIERPDSPDFLTADEDDRTTAVASDSSDDLTCPANEHSYAMRSSSISQASNSASGESTKRQTQSLRNSSEREEQVQETSISKLPGPPTDTKPFTTIPNEAIQTNILFAASHTESHKEQDPDTWASTAKSARSVVCEQPCSAQHKEPKQGALSHDGIAPVTGSERTANSASSPQLPVDLVGALPDELVSIIPEDLVRGAWNTARSFITRINQEMLSPTSDSPGRIYTCEEESTNEQPPPAAVPESEPQREETAQEGTPADSTVKEAPLPLEPPMQQLEDMGFHNRHVNRHLLIKYNGDVSCAVAELIVLNCH